jgi:hypothetical protein
MMGIVMKKVSLSVAAVVAMAFGVNAAAAADLPAKVYTKAPPVAAFDPWDIAFGAAISSDYVFRGITQSAHGTSGTAYFEPRYNFTKDLQVYVGTSWESISFPNRAANEVDIYGGIRPTIGAWAFDLGVWGYLYPGGQCFGSQGTGPNGVCSGTDFGVLGGGFNAFGGLPINGGYAKADASFFEVYGKVNYTFNDYFTLGGTFFYTPSYVNTGAEGEYASIVGKLTAPTTWMPNGIGAYVSGEFGRQWLGTSDAFYGTAAFPGGINYADYNTWNVGVGFTWKVFTLDLRYSDTDMSKGDCTALTSDFKTTSLGTPTANNPNGFQSNWCGSTFIAKLSADLTLQGNIK